jgi:hypothetical protein
MAEHSRSFGNDEESRLASRIERALRGQLVRIIYVPRWRSAWDIDVELDGRRAGPHAHSLCVDPDALVTDRLSEHVDPSFADDAERPYLLREYLEVLTRTYQIPLVDVADAGFDLPSDSASTALAGYWNKYEFTGLGRVDDLFKSVDEIGVALGKDNLEDLRRSLGHSSDPDIADDELVDLVENTGLYREEQLVRLLDTRAQRMHLALASPRSLMLRHPRLRSLPADRSTVRDLNDGSPAGAIPGTA